MTRRRLALPLSALLLPLFSACGDVAITARPEREGDDTGECSDDADNDEDGFFDCDDPDCLNSPECRPNQPPTAPQVEVLPDEAFAQDQLSCQMITPSEDPDEDEITYTMRWLVNGADSGITDATVPASETARGDTWTCVITPHDGFAPGPGGTDSVDIENSPPGPPEVAINPGAPQLMDDLTCRITQGSFDADGDEIEYAVEWLRNGGSVGVTEEVLPFLHTTVGDEWTCRVVPHDGIEAGEAGESTVSVHMDLVPEVSAGDYHSCTVLIDTNLACWGVDDGGVHDRGQVSDTPVLQPFIFVSSGRYHTCAARQDLTAACWGRDDQNQASPPLGQFQSISAGATHTCGVETTGVLTCWGSALTWSTLPPPGPFRAVSSGDGFSCMLGVDDRLSCWNAGFSPPSGEFLDVSAGEDFACAVSLDGVVECFGANDAGQVSGRPSPGSGTFVQVSAGANHACALADTGFVTCWGGNGAGQATPASGFFDQVSAGRTHSCGVRPDYSVVCWGCGSDDLGQCDAP